MFKIEITRVTDGQKLPIIEVLDGETVAITRTSDTKKNRGLSVILLGDFYGILSIKSRGVKDVRVPTLP